jgi:hypothetical protein
MTQSEAKQIIEPLKKKYQSSGLTGREILSKFTDEELTAYIALATFAYGRSWFRSLENAQLHMVARERAINLFSTKETDLMGATI